MPIPLPKGRIEEGRMIPWVLILSVLASLAIPMPSDDRADVGGIKKVPYSEFHEVVSKGKVLRGKGLRFGV